MNPKPAADVPDRLLARPCLVGVQHQRRGQSRHRVGVDVPHDREPSSVDLDVEAALQLHTGEAALGEAPLERGQLVVVQGDVET